MNSDLVSVIIPLYNVEDYIENCLKSVFTQTYPNIEIIVINDQSTDNSREIAEKILKNSPFPYQLADNEMNIGLGYTRNHGIELSHGKYLFFLDSDDTIGRCHIEHLLRGMEKENCDMAISSINEISDQSALPENDSLFCCSLFESQRHADLLRVHGYVWGALYLKSLVDQNNIRFTMSYMEDVLFNSQYLLHVKCITVVPSAIYYYYKHPGSLSRPKKRYTVALRNLECANTFDQDYLNAAYTDNAKELLEDRRYIRNCYFGELSCIGFKNHWKIKKGLSSKTPKDIKKHLRAFIKKSNFSLLEKAEEFVFSFEAAEWFIYLLAFSVRRILK